MELRLAKQEDLERLKLIWKLCFGDEDRYIDFYFNSRDWMKETAVLLLDEGIVSMLSMIPVELSAGNGLKHQAAMLYAIATHPEFQKRGLAERLMEFSSRYLMTKQIPATILVPAEAELFEFYRNRGYQDGFSLREVLLNHEQIEDLIHREPLLPCCVIPAESHEYNTKRKELLKGTCFVDYRDDEIDFQKKEAQLYGTDIFVIRQEEKTIGVATIEKYLDKVIVKELLIPDQSLISAIKEISELIPGERYIVRTPPAFGNALGGESRSFGMIKINPENNELRDSIPSYLGIAYD
ncbi:MAG: GNAT family N-acetyltransferase [Bacillota bacterium]